MVHVVFTCLWFMLNGLERFSIFPRGFYSITAAQFMFGIWWPPMLTYLYHSLCVLLFSFMVYFMSRCLLICSLFSFIFIYSHLCSFLFIFHFSRERLRRVLRKKSSRYIHLHTLTFADLHLHTFTPADLHLHTFTSADLLSLFFLFSLKAGAVPPERHETQPFRTKWTLDVKN